MAITKTTEITGIKVNPDDFAITYTSRAVFTETNDDGDVMDVRYANNAEKTVFHSEPVEVGGSNDGGDGYSTNLPEDQEGSVAIVANQLWTGDNIIAYRQSQDADYVYPGDTLSLDDTTISVGNVVDDSIAVDITQTGVYNIVASDVPDWAEVTFNTSGVIVRASEATSEQRGTTVTLTKNDVSTTFELRQHGDVGVDAYDGVNDEGTLFQITDSGVGGHILSDVTTNTTNEYGFDWTFRADINFWGYETPKIGYQVITFNGVTWDESGDFTLFDLEQSDENDTSWSYHTDDAFGLKEGATQYIAVQVAVGSAASEKIYIHKQDAV